MVDGNAFVVAPPSGVRVRSRFQPTDGEVSILRRIGEHLHGLYAADVNDRIAVGPVKQKDNQRARRKKALTGASSSRWAGSITNRANEQYRLSLMVLDHNIASLMAAVSMLEERLALPHNVSNGVKGRQHRKGYRDAGEWFAKRRRLEVLRARLRAAEHRRASNTVSVVLGGKHLLHLRNNLATAGISEREWRVKWDAARLFLSADGEGGKKYGNETIRVEPLSDGFGRLRIKVPDPLVDERGVGTHLTIATPLPVGSVHRGQQWLDRLHSNESVRYDITYDPQRDRWYLDASWKYPPPDFIPTVEHLTSQRHLAVDLNGDHLAAHVVDGSGNPVGSPVSIPLPMDGLSRTERDALLRHGISRLIRYAQRNDCAAIAVENLNFTDARATGRETMGRGRTGKRLRRTVAGIPTAQFRDRLAGMTHTVGLWLIAVNPRNTSKAGRKHWLPALKQKKPKNSRALPSSHHAAAVTIGRRAHLLRLSRHPSSPTARSAAPSASAKSVPQQKVHATTVSLDPDHPPPSSGTRWPEPVPTP